METFSASLAVCEGNSPVTGEFPAQKPVTWSIDVFFDLRLNKRLSQQSWGWWFETLSHPSWLHCNGGSGKKSALTLNGEVLEEVPRYILPTTNKGSLKHLIQEEINTKILDDIGNEAENKDRHWMGSRENIKVGKRPPYMEKLTRKQCNVKKMQEHQWSYEVQFWSITMQSWWVR